MKVVIHPLFFAAIIACAFFGGLPTALIYFLTALLHESGHIFCASRMGFECEKVQIMPYGAAAVCDIEGIRAGDEIKLALAGPMVNAATCVSLAGLWWFFPTSYAYTDVVMQANLSMLVINLVPCYPLDGGRVAGCLLTKLFGKRVSDVVLRSASGVAAVVLAVFFFLSGFNPTFLSFALFLLCSALQKSQKAGVINFSGKAKLKRGVEVKYILTDGSLTFRDAFKMLDDKKYLVFQRYDNGVADEITQDELYDMVSTKGYYDKVFDGEEDSYFSRNERENSSPFTPPSSTALTHSAPSETASSTAPEREE